MVPMAIPALVNDTAGNDNFCRASFSGDVAGEGCQPHQS